MVIEETPVCAEDVLQRRLGVAIHGKAAHEEPDAICPRLRRFIRQRLVAIEAPDD
jgi:hypothetical protein